MLLNRQSELLPKNFLSSKSIVIVDIPSKAGNMPIRGDWKNFSKKVHETFIKSGVDAVGYYHIDDIFSGAEISEHFAKKLKKREIKNLIFILEGAPSTTPRYSMIITPFNGKGSFMNKGQKAWAGESQELDKLLNTLYQTASQAKIRKSNLLITELPEFFGKAKIAGSKRFESFQPNLKGETLAVPLFEKIEAADNLPENVRKVIAELNATADANNKTLEIIMENYPYKYKFVDAGLSEKELNDKGMQYVLKHVNTIGKNIKQSLGYKYDDAETDFLSTVYEDGKNSFLKIPVDAYVFKYYIKQNFTKSIYLGTKWDADTSWEKSLTNHLLNLKEELKVN